MNILVVGGGGREHAIAETLSKSPLTTRLIVAPGNPGIEKFASCYPISAEDIEGLSVYADGVVAVAGNDIFFSQDGTSYLQLNKASVSGSGDNFSTFSGRSVSAFTAPEQSQFAVFEGVDDFGSVIMTDKSGSNKPFFFKMTGT